MFFVNYIGGASSIASASVTATPVAETQPVINSDDPAWAHCSCPDIKKKHSLKCNYCDKKINAGITRVKYHLAKISGFNVSACKKVPTPVQEEMAALINKKDGVKEQKRKSRERDREGIDIDKSDGERSSDEDCDTGNEVVLLRPAKGSASSRVVASGGTIDKFYKPRSVEESVENQIKGNISAKVQAKLTTQKREERRDRVCEYYPRLHYTWLDII